MTESPPYMLHRVVDWAEANEDVRASILVGSHAGKDETDEFSDYDVALFVTDQDRYANDQSWLSDLGEVWLCEKNTVSGGDLSPVHFRLTVFAPDVGVDFSIHSAQMLDQIVQTDAPPGPDWYTLGYRVLVDRDGRTQGMAAPFSRPLEYERPSENDFHRTIEDFWHEAHNVAKYLARGDLWSATFRDWESKKFLLGMIEWHVHAKYGWQYNTSHLGNRMSSWVEPEVLQSLHESFAHFDARDSWSALLATVRLFQRIAPETADRLGYWYLDDVDRNMGDLIRAMKERSAQPSNRNV